MLDNTRRSKACRKYLSACGMIKRRIASHSDSSQMQFRSRFSLQVRYQYPPAGPDIRRWSNTFSSSKHRKCWPLLSQGNPGTFFSVRPSQRYIIFGEGPSTPLLRPTRTMALAHEIRFGRHDLAGRRLCVP